MAKINLPNGETINVPDDWNENDVNSFVSQNPDVLEENFDMKTSRFNVDRDDVSDRGVFFKPIARGLDVGFNERIPQAIAAATGNVEKLQKEVDEENAKNLTSLHDIYDTFDPYKASTYGEMLNDTKNYILEQLAVNVPQIGAMVTGAVVGTAAAPVAAPAAILTGAGAGKFLGALPFHYAASAARQVEETGEIDPVKAGAAAAGSSVLDTALFNLLTPFKGKAVGAPANIRQLRSRLGTAGSFLTGVSGAGAVESIQQGLERFAAGLDIVGPEATQEYIEAAIGGMLVAAPFSAISAATGATTPRGEGTASLESLEESSDVAAVQDIGDKSIGDILDAAFQPVEVEDARKSVASYLGEEAANKLPDDVVQTIAGQRQLTENISSIIPQLRNIYNDGRQRTRAAALQQKYIENVFKRREAFTPELRKSLNLLTNQAVDTIATDLLKTTDPNVKYHEDTVTSVDTHITKNLEELNIKTKEALSQRDRIGKDLLRVKKELEDQGISPQKRSELEASRNELQIKQREVADVIPQRKSKEEAAKDQARSYYKRRADKIRQAADDIASGALTKEEAAASNYARPEFIPETTKALNKIANELKLLNKKLKDDSASILGLDDAGYGPKELRKAILKSPRISSKLKESKGKAKELDEKTTYELHEDPSQSKEKPLTREELKTIREKKGPSGHTLNPDFLSAIGKLRQLSEGSKRLKEFGKRLASVIDDFDSRPDKVVEVGNIIDVSLTPDTDPLVKAAAFESLWEFDFWTAAQKKTMMSDAVRLQKEINTNEGLIDLDNENLALDDFSKFTYLKNAFAYDHSKINLGKANQHFKAAFRDMDKIGKALKREMDDEYLTWDKVFPPESRQAISNDMIALNNAKDDLITATNLMKRGKADKQLEKYYRLADPETWDNNYDIKDLTVFEKYLTSMASISKTHPIFTMLSNAAKYQLELGLELKQMLQPTTHRIIIDGKNNGFFNTAHELLMHLDNTDQKINFVGDTLTYTRNGDQKTIVDKNFLDYLRLVNSHYKFGPTYMVRSFRIAIENLGVGLTRTANSAAMKEKATELETQIKQETDVTKVRELTQKASLLFDYMDNINYLNQLTLENVPYVPRKRYGNWGVIAKDAKGKNLGFYTADSSFFDKHKKNNKALEKVKERAVKELGKNVQFETVHMNRDRMQALAGKDLAKAGLLSEILSDPLNPLSTTYLKDKIKTYSDRVLNQEIRKAFIPKRKVPGYSTDWERVFTSFNEDMPLSASRMNFQNLWTKLYNEVHFNEKVPPKAREEAEKAFNYMTSGEADHAMLRQFNFMYALGLKPSTAMLNLLNSVIHSPAYITQWEGNPFTAAGKMSKGMGLASKLLLQSGHKGELSPIKLRNMFTRDNINRHIKDKELANFLVDIRPVLEQDLITEIGAKHDTTMLRGKIANKTEEFTNTLGVLISVFERISRTATAIGIYRSLNNEKTINRAISVLGRNNLEFQTLIKSQSGNRDLRNIIAEYGVEETHARWGKAGRGKAQRGLAGALVFPFMTHPMQMMELMARQAKDRGPAGKLAVLYTLTAYSAFAGMFAIPGWELLETLYEKKKEIFDGIKTTAAHDLEEWLEDNGIDGASNDVIRKGLPALMGMDVSYRVGLPLWPQNIINAVLKDQTNVADYAGVAGSFWQNIKEIPEALKKGQYGKAAEMVIPVALARDLMTTARWSHRGVETRRGSQLVAPHEIRASMLGLKAMGIEPNIVSERRDDFYYATQEAGRYSTALDPIKARLHDSYFRHVNARLSGDREEMARASMEWNEANKELLEVFRRLKIPNAKAKLKGIELSVKNEVASRFNPAYSLRPKISRQYLQEEYTEK